MFVIYHVISFDLGLWGLVNNAGMWCMSELEMTAEKVFQRCLDVNLMGTVRVTRSFLPMIRKSKGRVINMSSLVGKLYGTDITLFR